MVTTPRFPPSFAHFISLIRKMRTPHFRGNARKNVVLLRFITLFGVQRHAARRNARRARSCIVVHFTCPLVAQRFEGTFHVFALAKTFHFCAEDTLAYCSLLSAQKFHVRSGAARFHLLILPRCAGHQARSAACPHSICPAEKKFHSLCVLNT